MSIRYLELRGRRIEQSALISVVRAHFWWILLAARISVAKVCGERYWWITAFRVSKNSRFGSRTVRNSRWIGFLHSVQNDFSGETVTSEA